MGRVGPVHELGPWAWVKGGPGPAQAHEWSFYRAKLTNLGKKKSVTYILNHSVLGKCNM